MVIGSSLFPIECLLKKAQSIGGSIIVVVVVVEASDTLLEM